MAVVSPEMIPSGSVYYDTDVRHTFYAYTTGIFMSLTGARKHEPGHDKTNKTSLCWVHSHFFGFVMSRLISSYLSHIRRKRVFTYFQPVRFKPACSATEAS